MKKNLEYTAMESADIEAFREATMELDNTYSLFYKACGLSEAEYLSLIHISYPAEFSQPLTVELLEEHKAFVDECRQ